MYEQYVKAIQVNTLAEMKTAIENFLIENPRPYIDIINFTSDSLKCLIIYHI